MAREAFDPDRDIELGDTLRIYRGFWRRGRYSCVGDETREVVCEASGLKRHW